MQNKWLSVDDYKAMIELATRKYKFSRLLFLVADEIELFNQRVSSDGHEEKCRKSVEEKALEIEFEIKKAIPPGSLKNGSIMLTRWLPILYPKYWQSLFEVNKLFQSNLQFREDIKYTISEYADRRNKNFSEAQTLYLCNYVLHELPTLLYGVRHESKLYNKMICPAPSSAKIDLICQKLISNEYGFSLLKGPYCEIERWDLSEQHLNEH